MLLKFEGGFGKKGVPFGFPLVLQAYEKFGSVRDSNSRLPASEGLEI